MGNPARQSESGALRLDRDHDRPSESPYRLLSRLRSALMRPFDPLTVWRLRRQLEHQLLLLRQAEAMLTRADTFEKATVAARMGVWQCDLPSERLTWNSGTYDLFGRRRGEGLVRREILRNYSEESLARLHKARGDALEAGMGFGLDVEIRHPEAGRRWIRISATVERRNGEPVRLFGIKQDITEEKQLLERMRYLAERDVMTGLANRAQFEVLFAQSCGPEGTGGALMLIDLDGFKEVNDSFGHAVGDECLVEIARRVSAQCQRAQLIARIGGDEFAVLFGPAALRHSIETIARRIIAAAEQPMICSGSVFQVGASIGYAFVNGEAPTGVFTRADRALYAAKAAGRRIFRGPSRRAV